MSLTVYLFDDKTDDCVHEFNITHNLNEMADACGLYNTMWRPHRVIGVDDKDEDTVEVRAKEIIAQLKAGVNELWLNSEKYEKFNPKNGWGSFSGLINKAMEYKNACIKYPDATIHVSR